MFFCHLQGEPGAPIPPPAVQAQAGVVHSEQPGVVKPVVVPPQQAITDNIFQAVQTYPRDELTKFLDADPSRVNERGLH